MNGAQKSNRQKQRILVGAAQLIRQKGFRNTTIGDIGAKLKINSATIYYYFENKEKLLYEIACSSIDQLNEYAKGTCEKDVLPMEKLNMLIMKHLEISAIPRYLGGVAQFELKNLSPRLRKKYISRRDVYEQFYRDILQEGIDAGQFCDQDSILVGRFILGVLTSVSLWFKSSGQLSLDQVAEEVCRFISRSVQRY